MILRTPTLAAVNCCPDPVAIRPVLFFDSHQASHFGTRQDTLAHVANVSDELGLTVAASTGRRIDLCSGILAASKAFAAHQIGRGLGISRAVCESVWSSNLVLRR